MPHLQLNSAHDRNCDMETPCENNPRAVDRNSSVGLRPGSQQNLFQQGTIGTSFVLLHSATDVPGSSRLSSRIIEVTITGLVLAGVLAPW